MVNCPACGETNADDALFCTKCGTQLQSKTETTIEHQAKKFAENMEQMGKRLGDYITQAAERIQRNSQETGKRIERHIDDAGQSMQNWYDRTFGVIGPLLASFIFLIVFRLIILFLETVSIENTDTSQVATILMKYILPFFGVSLLSNYTTYFAKKSYNFRIFSPLLHAISFILILWIISRILIDVSVVYVIPGLETAAASLENSLPSIFVIVLLIGYVILYFNMERYKK
jgi:hypothetical protein